MTIGGALAPPGVLWGLVAGAGVLATLRLARVRFDMVDALLVLVGLMTSTVLAARVLPGAPEVVDVGLTIRFGATWIPAGLAAAAVAFRRGATRSSSFNTFLVWVGAGVLSLPAASAFGVLHTVSRRGGEAVFGRGDFMLVGFVVALVGVSMLLAVITRITGIATVSAVLLLTAFAGAQVGFTIPGLIENIASIVNIPNFWPPDFNWAIGDGQWWWVPSWEFGAPTQPNPVVETVRIAILASTIGCGVALPVAFMASRVTASSNAAYLGNKGLMNLIRTVPDLFWAMLFVSAVGIGPFAGTLALIMFTLAIMAKLLSETVDGADPGPLEAAKAAGSRHFPAIRSTVLPQVLPNYVAFFLYIFEITIRASAVIGLAGAGGVGRVLEAQRSFFRFDRVLAIVILIFAIVLVIEQISIAMRRRLV